MKGTQFESKPADEFEADFGDFEGPTEQKNDEFGDFEGDTGDKKG